MFGYLGISIIFLHFKLMFTVQLMFWYTNVVKMISYELCFLDILNHNENVTARQEMYI